MWKASFSFRPFMVKLDIGRPGLFLDLFEYIFIYGFIYWNKYINYSHFYILRVFIEIKMRFVWAVVFLTYNICILLFKMTKNFQIKFFLSPSSFSIHWYIFCLLPISWKTIAISNHIWSGFSVCEDTFEKKIKISFLWLEYFPVPTNYILVIDMHHSL